MNTTTTTITNRRAANKLAAATLNVIVQDRFSFWASYVIKLTRVEDYSIPTACTNGVDLKYNPDFIEELDDGLVQSLLIHEAAHVFLDHHLRLKPGVHDPQLANQAMDYVVNDMLKKAGMRIGNNWLLDPKYDWESWDWERVYRELEQKKKQQQQIDQPPTPQTPDQGSGSMTQQTQGSGDPPPPSSGDQPGEEKPGKDGDPQSGQSQPSRDSGTGSGSGSQPQTGDDQAGPGDVQPMPGKDGKEMTPEERQEKMTQSALDRTRAQVMAEKRKGVGDALRGVIGKLNAESVANWKEILSRFVGEVYKDDYSWMRPNTRYLDALPGIVMPSLYNEGQAKVGFAIDISGSVSTDEVRTMLGELMVAIETYEDASSDVEIPIIYFTHRFAGEEVLVSGDEPNPPQVSGGTSYVPVMTWLIEHAVDHDIEAMVIQTDGYCDKWGMEPPVPVLWVLSGRHKPKEYFNPPFGDVVVLGQGEGEEY